MGEIVTFQVIIMPVAPQPGDRITVSWKAPVSRIEHQQDYIGLYEVEGDELLGLVHHINTFGKPAGSATWLCPTVPGSYRAAYNLDNGDVTEAMSNMIVVAGAQPDYQILVAPAAADIDEQVQVEWIVKDGVATDPTDWIGLYHVGDPNEAHIAWFYIVDPTVTPTPDGGRNHFTMTFGAGQYEVRYLKEDGFDSVATSEVITVS